MTTITLDTLRQDYKAAYKAFLQAKANQNEINNLLDKLYSQSKDFDSEGYGIHADPACVWTTDVDNSQLDLSRALYRALRARDHALMEAAHALQVFLGVDHTQLTLAADGTSRYANPEWREAQRLVTEWQQEATQERDRTIAIARARGDY